MSDLFLSNRSWPGSRDVQRLHAAFENLEAKGILTVHNGPCCNSCVGAHIWNDAVPKAREAGRSLMGYVFYNEQTSESVAGGNDLYLICGPIPEPSGPSEFREAAARITSMVHRELEATGLRPRIAAQVNHVVRLPMDLTTASA